MKNRCAWVTDDPLYQKYHDTEWGVPLYNDAKLFEFLVLETFQAGLSWLTILKKRECFRDAFDNFDYEKIALYSQNKCEALSQDTSIIRNRLKIKATVYNAQSFLKIRLEFGTFSYYIWHFVNESPIQNRFTYASEIPSSTTLSDTISKDLKKRGFKFVGATIVYAYMQAIGMVNDHTTDCCCYTQINYHRRLLDE